MYAILAVDAKYFRRSFVKQVRKGVSDYDVRILLQPDFATAFAESSAECFAQGSDALVREAELTYRRWPFDVAAIERRVHMWQGLDDCLVPAAINKPVAERMPGAVWHPVEGAGHFVAVGKADEIFAVAAAELGASKPAA
jgi:pimeloyl-ACP methyl ester carboxylesterase